MPNWNFVRLDEDADFGEGQMKPNRYGIFVPQLYLELIENKSKVKPELKNVDYVCPLKSLDREAEDAEIFSPPELPQVDASFLTRISESSRESNKGSRNSAKSIESINSQDSSYGRKLTPMERKFLYLEKLKNMTSKTSELNKPSPVIPPQSLNEMREQRAEQKNVQNAEKQLLLGKINLFKSVYKNSGMPEVDMNTDFNFMQEEYQAKLKNIKISEKHLFLRKLLAGYFVIVEIGCGMLFKMDMKDFAKTQLLTIGNYDKYLVEICHKRYLPDAPSTIAVEWRLAGAVLIQTVGVVVIQKLFGKELSKIFQKVLSSVDLDNLVDTVTSFTGHKIPEMSSDIVEKTSVVESRPPRPEPKQKNIDPNEPVMMGPRRQA